MNNIPNVNHSHSSRRVHTKSQQVNKLSQSYQSFNIVGQTITKVLVIRERRRRSESINWHFTIHSKLAKGAWRKTKLCEENQFHFLVSQALSLFHSCFIYFCYFFIVGVKETGIRCASRAAKHAKTKWWHKTKTRGKNQTEFKNSTEDIGGPSSFSWGFSPRPRLRSANK